MRSSKPRRHQTSRGEYDGVILAGIKLGQPVFNIAAQKAHGQIWPARHCFGT